MFDGRTPDPRCLVDAARRLAIIDFSERGAQPMTLDGGRLRLVFYGEIYQELRRGLESRFAFDSGSDTEVLLCLFDVHHDDPAAMLAGVHGMFDAWAKQASGGRRRSCSSVVVAEGIAAEDGGGPVRRAAVGQALG